MIFFSIILSAFGIAFFCRLQYALAVYALPFFAAISAGLAAFHSGPGGIGAIIVGVAGIATLGAGQLAFGVVRSATHPRGNSTGLRGAGGSPAITRFSV